jgi:hypothetical protein
MQDASEKAQVWSVRQPMTAGDNFLNGDIS